MLSGPVQEVVKSNGNISWTWITRLILSMRALTSGERTSRQGTCRGTWTRGLCWTSYRGASHYGCLSPLLERLSRSILHNCNPCQCKTHDQLPRSIRFLLSQVTSRRGSGGEALVATDVSISSRYFFLFWPHIVWFHASMSYLWYSR